MEQEPFTAEDMRNYLERYGCFCGGYGDYTDYNCGVAMCLTCPHCRGTGRKKCRCERPTLACKVG